MSQTNPTHSTDPQEYPRTPQDFSTVLTELRPEHWPPEESDLRDISAICALVIAELDTWETKTRGQDVVDINQGLITTAQARRILAREVVVADDAVAIMLVPEGDERIHVEMRALIEDDHHLRGPELVLVWNYEGYEHEHHVALKPKGPQWYMLSQLRDDLLENRLEAR